MANEKFYESVEFSDIQLLQTGMTNKETLLQQFEELKAFFENTSFYEDDLSSLRKAQTAIRKKRTELSTTVKEYCKGLTSQIQSDADEVDAGLEEVLKAIQARFNELEMLYREEKRNTLLEEFEKEGHLVTFSEIENASWYNHTFSLEKALSELSFRVQLADQSLSKCEDELRPQILNVLRRHKYDAAKIFTINDEIEALKNPAEETEEESAGSETEIHYARIDVDRTHLARTIAFFASNGISYKLIDE